ncbi:MAG: MBL fold metallo-hydrolase [Nitrospirota bacterium]|nr:MBL fold metallo-hydrolase [Nitrospirota bacterium]MDP2382180.1 MBL fold metallo-hydrolase [Nitrospirota bacterium]MDP3595518.1 MBL fold metallo-hydrolase [Nitrospirota bacterium]
MMDRARVTEIAPDHYVISAYVPEFNLRFNHYLIKDDEPLLFHTGMKQMFPLVMDAVARIIDPGTIRWISFSHFEADECGALNEWLALAPRAEPLCGRVAALVSVNDFSVRPARILEQEEVLRTGRYRFRFRHTPHVPHGWEASLLFEEVTRTLLCSDLFTHEGDVEAITESDIVDRARLGLIKSQQGPFANAYPYTALTDPILQGLADLRPKQLALMHGSTFVGNGEQALRDLAVTMREVLGPGTGQVR